MGITPTRYFSSEVDPYAINLASANFPDILHIGSVTQIEYFNYPRPHLNRGNGYPIPIKEDIDLLIG